jgi:hypothetical protein
MDKSYWIGRKRAAMKMARAATSSEARLIHYDLAGRYSIQAAHALPFMLPDKGPDGEGERAVLRLHLPPLPNRRDIAPRPRPGGRKGPGFGDRNGGKQ